MKITPRLQDAEKRDLEVRSLPSNKPALQTSPARLPKCGRRKRTGQPRLLGPGGQRVFGKGALPPWLPSQENPRPFADKADNPTQICCVFGKKSLDSDFTVFGQLTAPPRTEGFVYVDAAIQLVRSRF